MAVYSLTDFSKVIGKKLEGVTGRKVASIRNRLEKSLTKEARGLFKFMSENVVNRSRNRFPAEYTTVPDWPPLNRAYAKRKGHNNFWFYQGVLDTWLYNTSPTRVLGSPKVSVTEKREAGGNTVILIRITPYPRAKNMNLQDRIYNRLFAKTKKRLGNSVVFASNEEVRPMFEPSLLYFADRNLKRTASQTIREVLSK